MSEDPGDLEQTREVPTQGAQQPGTLDAAFQNDLLAAWLDDMARGEIHDVAHYQAMFPGRSAEVAAELRRLTENEGDETAPHIPDVEILEQIGRGGQGVVYRGRQTYIERDVAVKVFAPKFWSADFADRFRREAKTLASLRHPNIVTCFQAGTAEAGLGFMVMEFVEGPNLREWIHENGPMPPEHALLICRDLARALEHAYEVGIIHRDVKPENVLLRTLPKPTAEGLPFEAKLADLGLARVGSKILTEETIQRTPVGVVMGSPLTMAPEQFDDPDGVDFRADIYGLGCVLFHALAGRTAFRSGQMTTLIQEKVAGDVPDVREAADSVTPDAARLVRRMLDPDPNKRPGSHTEVAERCEYLGLGSPASRVSRRVVATVVAVLLVVIVFVAWDPLGMVRAPTVAIAVSENPMEGQSVTLRVEASGSGAWNYDWQQIGEPRLSLGSRTGPEISFRAPRGLGDHEFRFAVTVSNGWRKTTREQRVRIGAIPELAPLAPNELRSLLRKDQGEVLADWRKVSEAGTWAGAQGHVGANGYCNHGVTRQTRPLPRGAWVLTGKLEPSASTWLKDSMERTARAGIEFEFDSGHFAALEVRRRADGTGFFAVVRHGASGAAGENFGDPVAGSWDEGQPLPFEIEWDGAVLRFSFGSVEGGQRVTRVLATPPLAAGFPPCAVSFLVENGRACFCSPALRAR